MEPTITGYVTPLSAPPGGTLEFKISSRNGRPVVAHAMRLVCCDPNPMGPGIKEVPAEFDLDSSYAADEQFTYLGSCAVGQLDLSQQFGGYKVALLAMPTLISNADQILLSLQNAKGTGGIALAVRDGKFVLKELASRHEYDLDLGIVANKWSRIEVAFDASGFQLAVTREPHAGLYPKSTATVAGLTDRALIGTSQVCFAALWAGHPQQVFNGCIESPTLSCLNSHGTWDIIADWNFGGDARDQWVADRLHPDRGLTLINMPTRAIRSSLWAGRTMDWKQAPSEYAAIAFHADDLDDCKWKTTIRLEVPPGMQSGVYGLEISNGEGCDTIPFYVTPAEHGPRKRILFLAPTFTYQAYANFARGNFAGELEERVHAWGAYPHNPDDIGAYGFSTYSRHPDGSGVTLSSRHRPILTMRPQYLVYFDPNGSGMRHFSADSHLTDWLEAKDYPFDVITDEDLDRDGLSALSPYQVVITGTHPEYHTRGTMEALIQYRERGGNLMYLGGNGFYWKIGRHQEMPHMIEVRRAEGGMRVWASSPGEYYHQLDGEYGGLWRRNGIPPQAVGGVGFTAEGAFEGSYYLRTSASYRDDLAFLFLGISPHERIGDFGLSGGGAAGFEIDQAASDLGTPDYATVVAHSVGHGASFHTTFEELLLPEVFDGPARPYGGISANIIYGKSETAGGIFAVGSITFCGSLSHNGYDNNVSRLLDNCLSRFLSDE